MCLHSPHHIMVISSGVCIWQVSRFQFKYLPQTPVSKISEVCWLTIHSIDEELPNLALIQKWNYCCDPVLETPDIGPWWDLMTWPRYLQYKGHSPSPLSLYYSVLCLCVTQYFVTVFFRTLARAWHVAKLIFAQLSTSSCDKCCCDTDLGQVSADKCVMLTCPVST